MTSAESPEQQIKRLADFITDEVPGEPSRSEGAVDVAIRLLRETRVNMDSGLVRHAKRELELIGEDDDTIRWYLRVITAFASFGHSGTSAEVTTEILNKLLKYEPLTDITDDPDEWQDRSEMSSHPIWQNKRWSRAMSTDGGKTYWLVGEDAGDGVTPRYQTTPHVPVG